MVIGDHPAAMVDQVEASRSGMNSEGPGIVVLSTSGNILHMNCQTQLLMCDVMSGALKSQRPNNLRGVLHPILIELAETILTVLQSRKDSQKGQFEIRHVVEGPDKRVLIRGIGLPSANGLKASRIVLVLVERSLGQRLQVPRGNIQRQLPSGSSPVL
jgi:hypothetical protein